MIGDEIIRYDVPRDVLVRLFWRRMLAKPARVVRIAVLLAAAATLFAVSDTTAGRVAALACVALAAITPLALYRAIRRAVDANPHFTDPKTLAFDASGLVVSGPDWRSEIPWTRFTGVNEDADYFYLELGTTGIASVVPKSAFAPAQAAAFREAAKATGTRRARTTAA